MDRRTLMRRTAYGVAGAGLLPPVWRFLPARLESARAVATSPSEGRPTVRRIVSSAPFLMLFVCFTTPPLFGYLATTQHTLYFAADRRRSLATRRS